MERNEIIALSYIEDHVVLVFFVFAILFVLVTMVLLLNLRSMRRAQRELESLNNSLVENSKVIAAAGYGMWRFLFDESGNVCGMMGNEKWHELFGAEGREFTPEERFQYYQERLTDKSREEIKDDYSDMREGEVTQRIFEWNHPVKGRIYLMAGGTRFVSADGTVSVSGYIGDVTVREQKQQEMNRRLEEARNAAETANAAKTTFLFNMSHDIRTPMNAIIGFRNLLEKYQDNPEKRRDYLKKIEDSSIVLLSIINNVLEMARIEKGIVKVDEVVWGVDQFNGSLFNVFDEMMRQKGITFTREIEVQHPFVYCDPIKLREVYLNIISNAYKYTESGGSVKMKLIELPHEKDGWVNFKTIISDTGIGMSEEFLPHIFDEFAREANTTENKIEGTGLGMSIVKRLVTFMDGTIEVFSEKGRGTVLTVTLPHRIAEKNLVVENVSIDVRPELFEGKRILFAEDNELNAEIAMEILMEMNFVADRVENGAECVRMIEEAPPGYYDLVLMDIQMPVMNGYEATRTIRMLNDLEKATIPIIAMTANAFEEDRRQAVLSGMNGHVAKPIDMKKLMEEISNSLR